MVLLVEDAALGSMANVLFSYRLGFFVFYGVFLTILLKRTGGMEVKRFTITYLW